MCRTISSRDLQVNNTDGPAHIDTVLQVLPHPCVKSLGLPAQLKRWDRNILAGQQEYLKFSL